MNKVLTVSQLNNYVKNVFEDELILQNITVEGEVFESKFSGGNTYITLKENDCVLSCVRFGSRLEFYTGDKIHVTGGVRFYPKGGKVTLVVNYAQAIGKGDLLVKLEELKKKLKEQGYLDNLKKLPAFIGKIALITSKEGAVIHDFLEVLARNGCGYIDVDVYDVRVQGANAEQTIARAFLSTKNKYYDVVVVARGGGSGQDLSCFNTELVAKSVFDCVYPVISAVGHEIDYTLCDFASSLRAGTPSIAAEKIVRQNEAFLGEMLEKLNELRLKAEGLVGQSASKAKRLCADLVLNCQQNFALYKSKVVALSSKRHGMLSSMVDKLYISAKEQISSQYRLTAELINNCDYELKMATNSLDKVSPLKILSKGYAKVLKDNQDVRSANDVRVGDKVKIVLSDGQIGATVTDKE